MAGPFNITTRGPMTAADWTALNPTLSQFEVGIEVNAATGAYEKAKIGDGRTAWTSLAYWNPGGPAGVKVYRALLTQTGTDAPVATVLENTLGGTVVWTRDSMGVYLGTLAGAFPTTKTVAFISNPDLFNNDYGIAYVYHKAETPSDVMTVKTMDTGAPADDLLANTSLMIYVYP